jgi:putative transposase
MQLFEDEGDYSSFERVMAEAQQRMPTRLLGYCLMPNHWHLVVWPREDGELSEWMRWLTVTHTQRWHAHHHSAGTGPIYQGRFKSFPIQEDEHLLTVLRYVERNALRAKLVDRAEAWRWGSLWRWVNRRRRLDDAPVLNDWPTASGGRPHRWIQQGNQAQTPEELEALRRSVQRGRPYGDTGWVKRMAARLGLESTLRPRGRPRKVV